MLILSLTYYLLIFSMRIDKDRIPINMHFDKMKE